MWAEVNQDRTPEASKLLQTVLKNSFDEDRWQYLFFVLDDLEQGQYPTPEGKYKKCKSFSGLHELLVLTKIDIRNFPQVIFFADQSEMQKTYNSIETAFTKSHSSVPLPLVKKYAFLQYKGKLLFSALKKNISIAEPGFDGPSMLALAEIGEILFLRWYMRFSAGIKEQTFDEGHKFWKIDRCIESTEDDLEKIRLLAMKELDSIIAVYEEENRKFAEFFC